MSLTFQPLHERQIAYREALKQKPDFARKRKQSVGCYGSCCGEYLYGSMLCTKCRRTSGNLACCGYWTISVNPRHRVPRAHQKGRWKLFLRKFPRYKHFEERKLEGTLTQNLTRIRGD